MTTTALPVPPSQIAARLVAAFRRFVADTQPDDDTIARYREAHETEDEAELCKDCLEYPAQYAGRCWTCNAGRRV